MAFIDQFLQYMIQVGASDFHMSSGVKPMFRIDGDIVPIQDAEAYTHEGLTATLEEIMPARNKEEYYEVFDTDFAYAIPGLARFRVNVFKDLNGIGSVIRQIPAKVLSCDDLNLPEAVRKLCHLSKGLVLVTGPTGSGKSTTLAAMIDHVNASRADHIITVEDPVEFVHQNKKCLINHREVHKHTMSFKSALRAALREDPDIVLVGELRDLETMEIAIETAETGHLVFGTLHTSTAPTTVNRMISQFPEERQAQIRTMLASSLKGVIAQTLCKKIGGGRVAALEILIGTHGVASNIRDDKIHQIPSTMETSKKIGMRVLNDHLIELVMDGIVDPKEAYFKCVEKKDMEARLRSAGYEIDI